MHGRKPNVYACHMGCCNTEGIDGWYSIRQLY